MAEVTNELFDEFVSSRVDELLEDEDYYQQMATNLKPASVIKQEHRELILKQLKMEELHTQLVMAEELIQEHLAEVDPNGYQKVIEELDNGSEHLMAFTPESSSETEEEKEEEKPVLLQAVFGISDESVKQIYALARYYAEKNEYSNARALFTYLTMLAPNQMIFWVLLGVCFQALNLDQEALETFAIVKALNPSEPASYIYSAESYLKLKEKGKAEQEMDEVKPFLEQHPGPWKESLDYVLQELKM